MSRRKTVTALELLVVVILAGVLVALSLPTIDVGLVRGQQTQVLSNMKQLHLATQQMALDGTTTGDTNIGWPGDTGGTFTNWVALLVTGQYLSTNDLIKLLRAPLPNPDKPTWRERWQAYRSPPSTNLPEANTNAVLIYNIREDSDGNVVFLTTANFTNTPTGGVLVTNSPLLASPGFVLFHKAGDGEVLQPRQARETNLIGGYAPLCR